MINLMLYAADEHYRTSAVPGTVAYENAVQVTPTPHKLVSLYAFNKSGATIYLAIQDTADAGADSGLVTDIIPIPAGSFAAMGVHGGSKFEKGIYLKGYTNTTLATPAGNDLFYRVDYTAYC